MEVKDYFTATTELAESSKKLYNTCIHKWIQCCGKRRSLNWIITHSDEAMECLRMNPDIKDTPRNHHLFISAVMAYVRRVKRNKKNIEIWSNLQNKNSEPIKEQGLSEEPTERQKETHMDWKDICKVRDELEIGIPKLLLGFYTYINPLRADYYACKILDETDVLPKDKNYLLLMEGGTRAKVVINDYKTRKIHGVLEHNVPEELFNILYEYIEKNGMPEYLLGNRSRKEYSDWGCGMLSKMMGHRMTLTSLRHAYIGSLDFNGSLRELSRTARGMGHSYSVQRRYKWEGGACAPHTPLLLDAESVL